MASVINDQKAPAVRQIDTIAITGAGAAADTIILTMNDKALTITIGSGTTTAQIANSIRDAWSNGARLDGTGDTTNTSNFGGQELGEFSEVTATIYATSNTIVRLISNKAGEPFTLAVSKTGTLTFTHTASSQAASGPEFWDNPKNWDGNAVPGNGDDITLANSSIGFKYGLPTTLQLRNSTFRIHKSFTGWLGLPPINKNNGSKPYPEYRTRYPVFFDYDGVSTGSPLFEIGLGDGDGSPLINIEFDAQIATAAPTFRVFDTGTPQTGLSKYALNIATDATSALTDLFVIKGWVAVGLREEGKSAVLHDVNVGYTTGQAGDVNLLLDNIGTVSGLDIIQNGGVITFVGPASSSINSWEMNNGVAYWRALAGITTLDIYAGNFNIIKSGTLTTVTIGKSGKIDLNTCTSGFTITNLDMYAGASFVDDNDFVTVTNGPDLVRCGLEDVVLRRGKHLRLTKGAVS